MKRMAASLVLLVSITPTTHAQTVVPAELDAYVAKVMRELNAPGAAIAIIKDDKIVYAKAFGVKELGKPEPVTTDTRFAIGSVSKSFTTTILGILADEKKLDWNDKVSKYLPAYAMWDPWVTRELTVRDLITHRTGLPPISGGTVWYGSDYSREEVLRRARFIEPVDSFRSKFSYQNVSFLAAGEVAHVAAGKSWDDQVRERIFAPVGMTHSTTGIPPMSSNVASPHAEIDGVLRVIPHRDYDNRFTHTPSFTADLEPWHYDTFRTHWRDPVITKGFVTFPLTAKGEIDALVFDQPSLLDADFRELDFHRVKEETGH